MAGAKDQGTVPHPLRSYRHTVPTHDPRATGPAPACCARRSSVLQASNLQTSMSTPLFFLVLHVPHGQLLSAAPPMSLRCTVVSNAY